MSLWTLLISSSAPNSVSIIVRRFLELFEAFGIEQAQIPRWISSIQYADLQDETRLLAALNPATLDQAAHLFGAEVSWLEGRNDLPLVPNWERPTLAGVLDGISAAVAASEAAGASWNPAPLRILTSTRQLDRSSQAEQHLHLAILRAIGNVGDDPVYRYQVFSAPYDWTRPEQRLKLKTITWLVHHGLRTPVPIYHLPAEKLDRILHGQDFPGPVVRRSIITSPSLDDYVQEEGSSAVAKETDELDQVMQMLDERGLRGYQFRSPTPFIAKQEQAPPEIEAAPPSPVAVADGKRNAQQANWEAIKAAAKALWAQAPSTSIATMIEQLKHMPHLKASAFSDSAIHKQIRDCAPASVRGKPGRKPKNLPT
jgi:hypothetical protein